MSYDNRVNKLHGFLRKAFGDYPASTWTAIVLIVGLTTLGIVFPGFGVVLLGLLGIAVVIIFLGWLWVTITDEWF